MGDYRSLETRLETFTVDTVLSFKFHTENPDVDEWLLSRLVLWKEEKLTSNSRIILLLFF